MTARRSFLHGLGRLGLGGAVAPFVSACQTLSAPRPAPRAGEHYDLVVIGTGFGGALTALTVAHAMEARLAGKNVAPLRILMLERGTWWTTPMETVQDKQVETRDFLLYKGQPTQEWSSLSDYRGMIDLVRRCRYSARRPQGLYDFSPIGKRGLFGVSNDGVSVLRASGVGGGSLIYSKILIRPPETLFDDPRWPGVWRGTAGSRLRTMYYQRAVTAISHGVEALLPNNASVQTGQTGISNILTRSPGAVPAALTTRDPLIPPTDGQRPLLRIRIKPADRKLEPRERELIDRARIFQTAISELTPHYGTVDLSINDMDFASGPQPRPDTRRPADASRSPPAKRTAVKLQGTNVCERHGRCNVGCLPGAGQTLNKQLLRAAYGTFDPDDFDKRQPTNAACLLRHVALKVQALTQVDYVSETADGAYLVHTLQRSAADPADPPESVVVSADRVIVAAGSLGTSELLLRSRQRAAETKGAEGLRDLSDKLGFGFSQNGDHLALLDDTRERVNLTFGPVTTSFGQFHPDAPQARGFHNIEDQGVPRSLAALAGHGFEVIRKFANDDGIDRYVEGIFNVLRAAHEIFTRTPRRTYPKESAFDLSDDRPESEDELTARMMCVVAQGKDEALGQFRLEDDRLRVARTDGKPFHEDPIYASIRATLDDLAKKLRPENSQARFISPLSDPQTVLPGQKPVVLTSHPLGGCPMGETVDSGVVDPFGRVFRKSDRPADYYRGLYIADGSVIPTALGVNPALTISAVALHCADRITAEWDQTSSSGARAAANLECDVVSRPGRR